jgi:hypothetical protein
MIKKMKKKKDAQLNIHCDIKPMYVSSFCLTLYSMVVSPFFFFFSITDIHCDNGLHHFNIIPISEYKLTLLVNFSHILSTTLPNFLVNTAK